MIKNICIGLLALLCTTTPIRTDASPIPDARPQIAAANERYLQGFRRHDYALMASDYERDGRYIAIGREVVGRRNVERFFAKRSAGVSFVGGNCNTTHLEIYGSTATETGTCRLSYRRLGHLTRLEGHYITVWAYHAENRRWLIRFNVIPA